MGHIVEEYIKREKEKSGLNRSEKEKYENTKAYIERAGVYNILKRTVTHLLTDKKEMEFRLKMTGGSYTDGKQITVAVPQYWWGAEHSLVYSCLKALTGHETEHHESSDFVLFVDFQKKVAADFKKSYKLHEQFGMKLGAHLLNSVEDGRIEKRLGNRMKGYVKHIQYMNAVIWDNQPVKGRDELQEFLFSITSMCVCGMKSKNWADVYGGTDLDVLLDQIRPLIIKGINKPTPDGCAKDTFEIYKLIAPTVAELIQKNQKSMDNMSMDFNFSNSKPQQSSDGGGGFPGSSVSTHLVPETPEEKKEDKKDDQSKGQQGQPSPSQNGQQGEPQDKDGQQGQKSDGSQQDQGKKDESSKQDGQGQKGEPTQDEKQDGEASGSGDPKKPEQPKEDPHDVTDHSKEQAKKEADMVKDFLRNAKKEMPKEMEREMEQVKNEEEKIKREEERKKRESGTLNESELKDVLSGRGVQRFTLEQLGIMPKAIPEDIASQGKKLHRQLDAILKDKQGYTSRNRKRGELDPTAIWKLGIKEYNTFIKKGKPDNSSYVVNLLVDNSGSMDDKVKGNKTKVEFAREATAVLEEGLRGLVPFRISRFDNTGAGVRHQLVSDFGDVDKVNRTWSTSDRTGNSNADSISIRVGTQELLKRPEQKKILFVLSDGLPSSYFNEKDAISSVQNAVRDARKAGVIVIAICFGTQQHLERTRDSYFKMYQKGIIMTEPQNIPAQLVKVLEREIKS